MSIIKVKKLRPSANIGKSHLADAGWDISASIEKTLFIDPGRWTVISTGLVLQLPFGVEGQIRPRSGIALKYGVTVLNSPGTIDAGYNGEIKVILINHGTKRFFINDGDRIAQICFSRIKQIELSLSSPEMEEIIEEEALDSRGNKGFGSSGSGLVTSDLN